MTESKRDFGTNFAKVDAHEILDEEYAEIPELMDEALDRAELRIAGKLVRRGRPKLGVTKELVSLRIDRDILEFYRGTGPGWQSRVNEVLRKQMTG